jgi:predicted AAA+ superfamily ATPase
MKSTRSLFLFIKKDLSSKMVFLGGPRQVGKTTFAKMLATEVASHTSAYFNWDIREDRKKIQNGILPADKDFLIFDEIHKMSKWKNWIKGLFDGHKDEYKILVTGSACLDTYKRGGDSLLGRYHYYRLHPFSVAELNNSLFNEKIVAKELHFLESLQSKKITERLFEFGGFPEMYIHANATELRRWHNERIDRLVQEDIRDLERVQDLGALETLMEILPGKVGSLFSVNAVREDLEINHKTAEHWMKILERIYYTYRISPFASTKIKSLKKQPKVYLWDWSELKDDGARLENMIASHLLKLTHFLYDAWGYKAELYFLRDIDGREVDFLVTVDRKPWFAVEVKLSDESVSKNLLYFKEKLSIPFAYQISMDTKDDVSVSGVRKMSVAKFLGGLV